MQNVDGVLIGQMVLGVLGNPLPLGQTKVRQIIQRETTHEICCSAAQYLGIKTNQIIASERWLQM